MGRHLEAHRPRQVGFSLLELLVALAIIAILSAVAVPLYRDYVQTSREGALLAGINTLALFQEDHRLRTGSYLLEAANAAEITAAISWRPSTGDATTYRIADGGDGNYQVTATDTAGTTVCVGLPIWVRC